MMANIVIIGNTEHQVMIERFDCVPTAVRVCHYDELGETAKQSFPTLSDGAPITTTIDRDTACAFRGCEVVKFTDYYSIDWR
jgi:hypothetical protein